MQATRITFNFFIQASQLHSKVGILEEEKVKRENEISQLRENLEKFENEKSELKEIRENCETQILELREYLSKSEIERSAISEQLEKIQEAMKKVEAKAQGNQKLAVGLGPIAETRVPKLTIFQPPSPPRSGVYLILMVHQTWDKAPSLSLGGFHKFQHSGKTHFGSLRLALGLSPLAVTMFKGVQKNWGVKKIIALLFSNFLELKKSLLKVYDIFSVSEDQIVQLTNEKNQLNDQLTGLANEKQQLLEGEFQTSLPYSYSNQSYPAVVAEWLEL